MAHTKSAGSTRLGRDSEAKRLGVKRFAGEKVEKGMVIIRQRGSHYAPGFGVAKGGDDTLYALRSGIVAFVTKTKTRFDGTRRKIKIVNVI